MKKTKQSYNHKLIPVLAVLVLLLLVLNGIDMSSLRNSQASTFSSDDAKLKLLANINRQTQELGRNINDLQDKLDLPRTDFSRVSTGIKSLKNQFDIDLATAPRPLKILKTPTPPIFNRNTYSTQPNPEPEKTNQPVFATAPPQAPSYFGIVTNSGNNYYQVAAALQWQDNATNEDKYVVERKTLSGNFEPVAYLPKDSSFFIDTYLIEGGTYYIYRIGAINKYGTTYSLENGIITASPITPAGMMPQNLDVKVLSPTSVQLNWYDNISIPEAYYYIWRTDSIVSYSEVIKFYSGGNPGTGYMNFIDQTAEPNTKYWYFITAEKFANNVFTGFPSSNIFEIVTPADPAPPQNPPSSISIIWGGSTITFGGQISSIINFSGVSNEKGYSIERSVHNQKNFVEIIKKNEPQPIPFAVDKHIQPSTTYYYRVRAYNDYGYGGYSPILQVIVP